MSNTGKVTFRWPVAAFQGVSRGHVKHGKGHIQVAGGCPSRVSVEVMSNTGKVTFRWLVAAFQGSVEVMSNTGKVTFRWPVAAFQVSVEVMSNTGKVTFRWLVAAFQGVSRGHIKHGKGHIQVAGGCLPGCQ